LKFSIKKVKRCESDSRSGGKSVNQRKSYGKKRAKTPSGEYVSSFVKNKSDSTKLVVKDNKDNEEIITNYTHVPDEIRYKGLQKKLELIYDYISLKAKGLCWAQKLFKAYEFSEKTFGILFKALAPSMFVNYQYGWGIFADFVLDTECCEYINKNECQIVYNKFLEWLQKLSNEYEIHNVNENQSNGLYLISNLNDLKKNIKNKNKLILKVLFNCK
jgi:hypothetical protein